MSCALARDGAAASAPYAPSTVPRGAPEQGVPLTDPGHPPGALTEAGAGGWGGDGVAGEYGGGRPDTTHYEHMVRSYTPPGPTGHSFTSMRPNPGVLDRVRAALYSTKTCMPFGYTFCLACVKMGLLIKQATCRHHGRFTG